MEVVDFIPDEPHEVFDRLKVVLAVVLYLINIHNKSIKKVVWNSFAQLAFTVLKFLAWNSSRDIFASSKWVSM